MLEPKERRILVIDRDAGSLEIIATALGWEGYQVTKLSSVAQADNHIKLLQPHLILLDTQSCSDSTAETVRQFKDQEQFVSVMLISEDTSSAAVVNGLDAGADDYLPKPFDPQELLARVRTQLRIRDVNDQLRRANLRLKELVDTDDLTGLFNMRSLYQRLDFELERARRFGRQICVVMMDMDHFKSVNDGHDHLFGSFVLSEVGGIIRQNIRAVDIGARYGGDEFLIVLTEVTKEGAQLFCERLRHAVAAKLYKNGSDEMHLTASLGFAMTPLGMNLKGGHIEAKELVRIADNALYEAKGAGRNCVRWTELNLPVPIKPPASGRKKAS